MGIDPRGGYQLLERRCELQVVVRDDLRARYCLQHQIEVTHVEGEKRV